jgi:RNA polymerase sigma-70 factor, ECF subfamily
MDKREPHRTEDFVVLYANHQRQLLGYLVTLVHDLHDAEDLLQQTALILWRKFEEFAPDSDFCRWACRIAHLEAISFLRTRQSKRARLSDELLAELAKERLEYARHYDCYRDLLQGCLEKLAPRDRELVRRCYAETGRIREIAPRMGRTADSVYHSLQRIRRSLLDCIERALSRE